MRHVLGPLRNAAAKLHDPVAQIVNELAKDLEKPPDA
jgi:hypothetical protein